MSNHIINMSVNLKQKTEFCYGKGGGGEGGRGGGGGAGDTP